MDLQDYKCGRKGKNKDGNNFNCIGNYMERNDWTVCGGSTDLGVCLDYGEDWTKEVKISRHNARTVIK